jgi:polyisoprenoid-binding protein YceI
MIRRAAALIALALGACSLTGTKSTTSLQSLPKGAYTLQKAHSSLFFRVKHMGLSNYTVRIVDFDATLDFNPQTPAASHVKAIINPLSIQADHPEDKEWDKRIGEDLLEGAEFPQIVFDSKKIEVTGEFTGKVTGDLVFLGETYPVTLDVTYNGAAKGALLYDGKDAVGFSAHAVLSRSDLGVTRYSSIVQDPVEIIIEAEFVKG